AGDAIRPIERAEPSEQIVGAREHCGRRRIEPTQPARRACPGHLSSARPWLRALTGGRNFRLESAPVRELERERCEIGLDDLRWGIGCERSVRLLAPQAITNARI